MADRAQSSRLGAGENPVVSEIVRRLVDLYDPERIYLFGSMARGDATPDSDYDFMVVVPDDAPPERTETKKVYTELWGIPVPIEVVVWTCNTFDSQLHLKASFPSTIVREGKLLYAA